MGSEQPLRVICLIRHSFGIPLLHELARHADVTLVRVGQRSLLQQLKFSVKAALADVSTATRKHAHEEMDYAARSAGVKTKWTASLSDADFIAWLKSQRPDLLLVASCKTILKEPVIETARFAVNFHPSLLPAYRGPVPSYWVFKNQEKESGVTCHLLTTRIDAGDIVFQEKFAITNQMTPKEYQTTAALLCVPMVEKLLNQVKAGALIGVPQDETQATYFGFPTGD